MRPLKKAIDAAGGVPAVATACGKTPRAIYKWITADCLPRTEYTGETDYAARIAKLAEDKGQPFDVQLLLAEARPSKSAA
ncbi:helix-turn-helix domain-containing protein [Pseudomonas sp. LJDD11]|uniref:helix-turn-helix domain-containing protein n=1 Tax=Pseudomonas sp. LJDD11 TaxID=2931984 RepID=UPI00211CF57A|nr:helix-turn-helix domain-containing protein [Pseudomonas sp. LJDD11]MCQ9423455.1 helix-turn-helix domain-containing protein [Pseudomonas sp. LJDD11]